MSGPGKVAWEYCGNVNCAQTAVTHSRLCLCAHWSRRWWAGVQHSDARMCGSIICRAGFRLSFLSLCVSPCFTPSFAPSFIRTRRPGRKWFWLDWRVFYFILGTEVLEAAKQRLFGSGEPGRHKRCQIDETMLSPYKNTAIKSGTNEQDIQYVITLIKQMYGLFYDGN